MVLGYKNRLSGVVNAENTRNSNDDGTDEESCHNRKGEDPLEGHNLSEELSHTERSSQCAEGETHRVILVDDQEKQAINQD